MPNARPILTALVVTLAVSTGFPSPTRTNGLSAVAAERAPSHEVQHLSLGREAQSIEGRLAPAISPPTAHRQEPERPADPPLTADERELIESAEARFALVGLDLPDVDISFHEDTEPCDGNDGTFHGDGDHRRIRVCIPDRDTYFFQLERRRTLYHELAHAWDHANLDDDDREALLDVVDASSWYSTDLDWAQRGVERFAETIVWGLYDQLSRPTLIDVPCHELHADFKAITSSVAPGPLEGACALETEPLSMDASASRPDLRFIE
jgi:hypothetical protein